MAEVDPDEQCIAETNAGDRCSRLAKEGQFCFQHAASDKTVEPIEPGSDRIVTIVSDRLESASVTLSGAPRDLKQNFADIINESENLGTALASADFTEALNHLKETAGKTGPTTGKGAVIGGVLGSPFGPIGIATGVTVGGWYGVLRSLDDDRAVAASVVDDVPADATVVSSEDDRIVDVDPIQMAIKSARENDTNQAEWLRGTAL